MPFPPAQIGYNRTDNTANAANQAADHNLLAANINSTVTELVGYEATTTSQMNALQVRMAAAEAALAALGSSTSAPVFIAAGPPDGIVGTAYSYTFIASGTPAPTFAVVTGALPGGLVLNATTGVLSGTPTTAALFGFNIRALNSVGNQVAFCPINVTASSTITDPLARYSLARPGGGAWTLRWNDEFDGLAAQGANSFSSGVGASGSNAQGVNTQRWQPNWLAGNDTDITKGVNGNNTAAYAPSALAVANGVLTVNATATQTTTTAGSSFPNRSGLVNTKTKTNGTWVKGFFEWRVFLSVNNGAISNWPAIWLNELANTSEPDVMEGLNGHWATNLHNIGGAGSPSAVPASSPSVSGWHEFGLNIIQNTSMQVFYDGVSVLGPTSSSPAHTWYMVMNLACGPNGTSGGPTVLPSLMQVEFARVWD